MVGVATLTSSFLPTGSQAFYFIDRPPRPNILTASVSKLFTLARNIAVRLEVSSLADKMFLSQTNYTLIDNK